MPRPARRAHRLAMELVSIERFFDTFLGVSGDDPGFKEKKRYKDLLGHRDFVIKEYDKEAKKEPL